MDDRLDELVNGKWEMNNTTAMYLFWAHDCFKCGDIEMGKRYLMSLCKKVSNYEESIELNGLTEVWEKYKHYVEGMIPPPVVGYGQAALSPERCTTPIGEILDGPDADMLTDLSAHLGELSGNGSMLNFLNKWERAVYYADELCMEVNSGGFGGYLYYHGTHFEKAYQAIGQMGAPKMTALLDTVRSKFPRGRLPKSLEAIQNAMDALEEREIDFEDEDDVYYSAAEGELLARMKDFVLENRKRFR